jgi:tetratricopeptide (TPR) repeat protein
MSLLMKALKKAELAKQEKSWQSADTPQAPAQQEIPSPSSVPASTESASEARPLPALLAAGAEIPELPPTRTLKQRVEPVLLTPELTLTEVVAKQDAVKPETAALPDPDNSKNTSASQPAAPRAAEKAPEVNAQEKKVLTDQQKAKSVFSAKQSARSSRTLLIAGIVVVLAVGAGGFGYYYWQITNQSSVNFAAGKMEAITPAPTATPGVASAPPAADAAPTVSDAASVPQQNLPSAPAAEVPPPAATPPPVANAKPASTARSGVPADSQAIRVRQSTSSPQINPSLSQAYRSFVAGDVEVAQQQYQKVLQQEPNSRDALLGLAAIALNRGQTGQAAAHYSRLLELDPADSEAMAGLIGLQTQGDPGQNESRLKKILAQNPQAAGAHFALGSLYAQQSRWAEAQQSYFRAYSGVPSNADYAFNLAVSLDTLNQGKLALDYYQRALALAQSSLSNFDKNTVQNRIKELQSAASN